MKPIEKIAPLTEATFYVLLALRVPRHGYGIIKRVEEISGGRLVLAAGTLYGILGNLLDLEIIAPVAAGLPGASVDSGARKKVYRLTERGQALVVYEIERLRLLLAQAIKEQEIMETDIVE